MIIDKIGFENYIQAQNKRHIIFDFDKTITKLLVDWSYKHKELNALFLSYDKNFDLNNFNDRQDAQKFYIENHGQEVREKIVDINYQAEKNHYSGHELVPLALEIVDIARKHAKLYIWSSNDKRTIDKIIKELNIDLYFDKIVSRNDVYFTKPSPDGFELIFDTNSFKSNYLMIGDSDYDRLAAKKSGIDFMNIKDFSI
ncbi:MAG: hypothetical protein ACD_72C00092G0002 [uncultured bacterium]|nr:MAG: hypothetical protein ACD_72C00092G0002 [uncultured bacterium]